MNLLIGEDTLALLPSANNNNNSISEFYLGFKELMNIKDFKYKSVFGIFYDENFFTIKKKMKLNFADNISLYNFIFILEGDNSDAYYTNKHETNKLIGIEIRFDKSLNKDYNWEEEARQIEKKIILEKLKNWS